MRLCFFNYNSLIFYFKKHVWASMNEKIKAEHYDRVKYLNQNKIMTSRVIISNIYYFFFVNSSPTNRKFI